MKKMAAVVGTLTACSLLFSMQGASATTLTPEQQELVKKYKISVADQKKLFGTQQAAPAPVAAANAPAPRRQPPARTYSVVDENSNPVNSLLANSYVWVGGDAYKSIGDRITNINGGTGGLTNSSGVVGGFNTSFGIGDFPIRVQAGASYGVYDFKGRLRIVPNATDTENQTFYTVGVYRRGDMSNERDPISVGIVYDTFRASRWGANANEIQLSQLRGIFGYAVTESTEVGVWGAMQLDGDRAAVTVAGAPNVRRPIRSMDHGNVYVKHNFDFGGQLTAYVGMLDNASIGHIQYGVTGQVPLSHNWSVFAHANYVVPNAVEGPMGSGLEQFNISFGLTYYFGGKASSASVTGHKNLPLLPVANNSSFLITD